MNRAHSTDGQRRWGTESQTLRSNLNIDRSSCDLDGRSLFPSGGGNGSPEQQRDERTGGWQGRHAVGCGRPWRQHPSKDRVPPGVGERGSLGAGALGSLVPRGARSPPAELTPDAALAQAPLGCTSVLEVVTLGRQRGKWVQERQSHSHVLK